MTNNTFKRRVIVYITAFSFYFSTIAPPAMAAESIALGNGVVRALRVAALADTSTERELRQLRDRLDGIERTSRAQQDLISQLSRLLREKDIVSGVKESAKTELAKELSSLPDGPVKDALQKLLGKVKAGDWVTGKAESEIASTMNDLKVAASALKEEIETKRRSINEAIESVCQGNDPRKWEPLKKLVVTSLPNTWTADLAGRAKAAGIALPGCFQTPLPGDSRGANVGDLVDDYQRSVDSAAALNGMMSNMMMMAMSTGNPYIIAAAIAIMAIMAIFSDGGSGGGDGNGKGTGEGDSTIASGAGDSESSRSNRGESSEGKGQGSSQAESGISSGGVQTLGGSVRVVRTGETLRFSDTKTGIKMVVSWKNIKLEGGDPLPPMPAVLPIKSATPAERKAQFELSIGGRPCNVVIKPAEGDDSETLYDAEVEYF